MFDKKCIEAILNAIELLHTLNVYKIPRKEHQVVDFWVAYKILASEILFWKYSKYVPLIECNYKKTKNAEFFMI